MNSLRRALFSFALASLLVSIPVEAQDEEIFFGNLHSHTSYSDGSSTPEVAYAHARDVAGLDFIAITEHNHADAGRIATDPSLYSGATSVSLKSCAERFSENGRFVAIYGQEFSTIKSGNHMNVFEVSQVIDVESGEFDDFLDTWLPANLDSTGQQALLLLNPPATSKSPNDKEYGQDDFSSADEWREKLDARAELINLINGPSHDAGTGLRPGRPSESEFLRYLNLGLHLAPTADQDNHFENWGDATDARTAVLAAELSKPAILAALRNRHVYATEDRNLRIIARVNGHLIGSRVSGVDLPAANSELDIRLNVEDDDEPTAFYEVEVFSDEIGGEVAEVVTRVSEQPAGEIRITGVRYSGGEEYVFLRITQSHDDVAGEDRVWTAPVWFETAGAMPPPGGVSAVALVVDPFAEEAQVINMGDTAIDLGGWHLVSTRGSQEFIFPEGTVVGTGEENTVTVTSGPDSRDQPPAFLRWHPTRTDHIWNNSGDPGELYDAEGRLVAETGGE